VADRLSPVNGRNPGKVNCKKACKPCGFQRYDSFAKFKILGYKAVLFQIFKIFISDF
jgi:hypothetical protein